MQGLLHKSSRKAIILEDIFQMMQFRLSEFQVAEVVCPILHTPQHSSNGLGMVVQAEGYNYVPLCVAGFVMDNVSRLLLNSSGYKDI